MNNRFRRIVSMLLATTLVFSLGLNASAANATKKANQAAKAAKEDAKEAADDLKDAQNQQKELEKDKDSAQKAIQELEAKVDKLLDEIDEMKDKIASKQEEIEDKEQELYAAQVDENNQYEAMKKRIKYMYESGNREFVEIVLASEDFSDLLNNVEYVSTLSSYDRNMLKKFQKVREQIESQKETLEKERDELSDMQDQMVAKQEEAESTIEAKTSEISDLKEQLASNKEQQKKLKSAKEAAELVAKQKQEEATAVAASVAAGAGEAVVSGNGTFTHPCPGYTRISSTFGPRTAPIAGASTNHKGIDFAAPTGTPIYAAADGTVVSACYSSTAGNLVIINHGDGLSTYYMHTSKMYVKAGQKVTKGQNIAAVGTTGNSTGPHLHFQVMLNGTAVNPLNYL